MRFSTWVLPFTAGAALLTVAPGSLESQERKNSEVRGVIVVAADRKPVSGASVSLEGTELTLTSDSRGRFQFPRITAGRYIIRAEVDGYPALTSAFTIADGERLEMEFLVGEGGELGAQVLPEIAVAADATPTISPIADFNRRALSGRGRFITREFIEQRNPGSTTDLFRGLPGIRVVCESRSGGECQLRVARSGDSCQPAFLMDGIPAHPMVLYTTVPGDIEGIEIYSGPAETPVELDYRRSNCGTVAIWTRLGRGRP